MNLNLLMKKIREMFSLLHFCLPQNTEQETLRNYLNRCLAQILLTVGYKVWSHLPEFPPGPYHRLCILPISLQQNANAASKSRQARTRITVASSLSGRFLYNISRLFRKFKNVLRGFSFLSVAPPT